MELREMYQPTEGLLSAPQQGYFHEADYQLYLWTDLMNYLNEDN